MAWVPPQLSIPQPAKVAPPKGNAIINRVLGNGAPLFGQIGHALNDMTQQQQVQASTAGSLLAQKSHPQTLPQGAPGPGVPPPGAAPKPPAPPTDPTLAPQQMIDTLQKRITGVDLPRQDKAYDALAAAIGAPQAELPTYTAPEAPKPNIGMALGAALAGIFAPKYAQGTIDGLGITQANEQKKYQGDLDASKLNYEVAKDTYTAKDKQRSGLIDDRSKVADLTDKITKNDLSTLSSADSTLERAIAAVKRHEEHAATLTELKRHHNQQYEIAEKNLEARNKGLNNAMFRFSERLKFDRVKDSETQSYRASSLATSLERAGIASETAINIATARTQAEFVLKQSSQWQQSHQQLVRQSHQVVHDTQEAYTNLMRVNPTEGRKYAAQFANFLNGDRGQKFQAALLGAGGGGEAVEDAVISAAAAMNPGTTDRATGAAVPGITINMPNYQTPEAPNPLYQPDGSLNIPELAHVIQRTHPGGGGGGGGSNNQKQGGGNNQGGGFKQPAHNDVVPPGLDANTLSLAKKTYEDAKKLNNGDPRKAWLVTSPGFKKTPPELVEKYRRAIMGGGTQGGGKPAAGSSQTSQLPGESMQMASAYDIGSKTFGVPIKMLLAVSRQESGLHAEAVSPAGAVGPMQLMPGTAQGLGVTDINNPVQNILGGSKYLGTLHKQFGSWPLALAAYNAGPNAVRQYRGIPPFPETQNYVRSIMASLNQR